MPELVSRLQSALSDSYRLDREAGAGGMATVYLAQDLRHDRRVALKVLRPELAAVIGADRFLAEIKLTANLQHPHGAGFSVGKQRVLFPASDFARPNAVPSFWLTPDDKRFLIVREGEASQQSELIVAENWLDELREK